MLAESTQSPVTLAILAGGQSLRMGRSKAELRFGEKPVLAYLADRFRWKGPTLLVTAPQQSPPPGAELFDYVVRDSVGGEGPLRGVLTALEHAQTELIVVATVDMPVVEQTHLLQVCALLGARHQSSIVMLYRLDQPNAIEAFPSVYRRPGAEHLISSQLETGQRALRSLRNLPGVEVVLAPDSWSPLVWTNLNSPADLASFASTGELENRK